MNKLNLHLPLNSVSFGQISCLILKTLFEKIKNGNNEYDLTLFPIGNVDLSSQKIEEDFKNWLNSLVVKGLETHSRDVPTFRLWHINGAESSLSTKQSLLTFYELDSPTKVELNIAKNNNIIFTSEYSCNVFKLFGVNCKYVPLAFDDYNFKKLDKKYHDDGRIVFNLCGKLEKRKHHAKAIQTWIKAFGNDRRYHLQCAIFNPFLSPEQNQEFIKQILGGDKPFNVNFFPNFKENYIYNDFLNSGDIVLGLGNESWGLPEFQSVAIGKHSVILDCNGHQGWANTENSVLLSPSGKIDSSDNIFFKKGDMFNQGNFFDFNDEEFVVACKKAISKVESNRVNLEGLQLQNIFTKEKFVDSLLKISI